MKKRQHRKLHKQLVKFMHQNGFAIVDTNMMDRRAERIINGTRWETIEFRPGEYEGMSLRLEGTYMGDINVLNRINNRVSARR
ncbi:hypothetical protein LOX61_01455 [Latilactobacillus curvatus]|uniref:hypothetical protein n=1 Tax=Latilactobacillus curvatus TaxID=28038 RepID=UPI0020C7F96B|nr:hypothetical protein [Latilactobacillus curvatus]MCP8849169.1 hypothetical protein [Latilactobacillus curvatus]